MGYLSGGPGTEMSERQYYIVVSDKTILIPLRQIYPECAVLLAGSPNAENLQCLRYGTCNQSVDTCMRILAERVDKFFRLQPEERTHMLAYYKTPSGSLRGCWFTSDFDEPKVVTCNKHAFDRLRYYGEIHSWEPDSSFYGGLVSIGTKKALA